jgi:hypothetical protein
MTVIQFLAAWTLASFLLGPIIGKCIKEQLS